MKPTPTRKRLLLLTQGFPPETYAAANRFRPMADALNRYYDLTVVTLKPSYPSPDVYRGIPLEDHDAEFPYEIRRGFHFSPHSGSLPVRTVREQAMALRLAARALRSPADVVLASSPSMFLGPVGLALARAKGAKFVWEIRDIIWGYAKDQVGASPKMVLAARALERYMLSTVRRADLLIGVSAGITQVLLEYGVDPDRVITAPNGISVEMLSAITTRVREKPENARPIVSYVGLIGYNQGLKSLVEVAKTLPEVDFVLAGDGPELSLLKRRAAEMGLKNISFRGYLNREKLLQVYAESDILFAQTRNAPTISATMVPVKLFEYMATGRPIVYAGNGIASDLLARIGCAEQAQPEDPKSISAAISRLLHGPGRMQELGQRGRVAVQKDFHRDNLMDELARNLEGYLAGSSQRKVSRASGRFLQHLRRIAVR